MRESANTSYIRSLCRLPHLKWRAFNYAYNDRRPAVEATRLVALFGGGLPHDLADGRPVVVLHSSSQGIREQFLGNGRNKLFGVAQQNLPKLYRTLKPRAVWKGARIIDRRLRDRDIRLVPDLLDFSGSPPAD